MSLKCVVVCLCMFSASAGADELEQAARGLEVRVEHLSGNTALNGLPVALSHATGRDVPQLVDRILHRWREQTGADSIRTGLCCGWQIAGRIESGRSEVVQWRITPTHSELILSSADLLHPGRGVAKPTLLPGGGCRWSAPVQGVVADRQYLQLTARCSLGAGELLSRLERQLSSEGWSWQKSGASLLQAQRGVIAQQWIASQAGTVRGSDVPGSTLVLIETRPAAGHQP